MANNRKSFILHLDSLDVLDELTDEQAGKLFKAIKAYKKGSELELDQILKIVFSPFKNQFVRDDEKYKKTCEARAIAGSKGGKQKVANASKSKQKVANLADSDSKSDNDSDSKKEKTILLDSFSFWWSNYPSERRTAKQKCFSKWKSICKNLSDDHIELLVNQISEDITGRISKAEDIKYIPLTTTYLNNERWNDGQ